MTKEEPQSKKRAAVDNTMLRLSSGDYSILDLDKMDYDQLAERLEEIACAQSNISDQLSIAKTNRITTGKYADPDWFRRTKSAMRIYERFRNQVARLRKKAHPVRIESIFMDVARERLSREAFEDLLKEAKRRSY